MIPRLLVLVALFATPLTGCDRGTAEPELVLGASACHRCGSIVTDATWAAADGAGGTTRIYDDPGCLLASQREEATDERAVVFQDRAGSGTWIPASDVWLARSDSFPSPRASGWAAFATFAAAQDAVTAAGHGEIVRYDDALLADDPPS